MKDRAKASAGRALITTCSVIFDVHVYLAARIKNARSSPSGTGRHLLPGYEAFFNIRSNRTLAPVCFFELFHGPAKKGCVSALEIAGQIIQDRPL